jgi:hypothetical protein
MVAGGKDALAHSKFALLCLLLRVCFAFDQAGAKAAPLFLRTAPEPPNCLLELNASQPRKIGKKAYLNPFSEMGWVGARGLPKEIDREREREKQLFGRDIQPGEISPFM